MNTPDRQHVNRELATYGKVMHELFRHMIALKRFELAGLENSELEEKMARAAIIRTVAGMKRFLQPEDWNRIKWFYSGLKNVDMAGDDGNIIEEVLHQYGVQRLST